MACEVSQKYVKDIVSSRPWAGPVIDLGSGGLEYYYNSFFPGQQYIRLDIERRPTWGINIVADILNMPLVVSNTFGVVLLLETLEHLADPFAAFRESARILKPGGLFICTTVSVWPEHKHPKDYWRFYPDGLKELCKAAGLKLIDCKLLPNPTTGHQHCNCAATK